MSDQSGPGINGNEEVLHIPQNSRTGALQSDCLNVISWTLNWREEIGVLNSPR